MEESDDNEMIDFLDSKNKLIDPKYTKINMMNSDASSLSSGIFEKKKEINQDLLQMLNYSVKEKDNKIILDALLLNSKIDLKKSPLENIINLEKNSFFKENDTIKEKVDSCVSPSHDIIRALHPVKKFGLVLGIVMTSTDGTSSEEANIEATYQIMTDAVASFYKQHPGNSNFQKIAEAFDFSNTHCAFRLSKTTRDPDSSEDLCQRIQNGQLTTIPVSCNHHIMGLAYIPDYPGARSGYLVYTNRGAGAHEDHGTKIFQINDARIISAEFIHHMLFGLTNNTAYESIWSEIETVTDHRSPLYQINQSPQKRGNCSIANPKSNIHGILLCQKAIALGGFDKLTREEILNVEREYKTFTHAMRREFIEKLARNLLDHPQDQDTKMLATKYLEQHLHADRSLRTILEEALKQALAQSPSRKEEAIMVSSIDKMDISKDPSHMPADWTIFNLFEKSRAAIHMDSFKRLQFPSP